MSAEMRLFHDNISLMLAAPKYRFGFEFLDSYFSHLTMKRALRYVILAFLFLLLWGGWRGAYRQYVFVPRLQTSFGFTAGDTYLSSGSFILKQYPQIQSVEPGSAFDLAGFQIDDIVVSDSYSSFFDKLNRLGSNEETTFSVGRGVSPLDTSHLALRTVKVRIKR